MLSSYLKIALRNFLARKSSALLNVLGLAIGMTCCLLIFQYVSYEHSYDRFETAASRTYRLRLDQYEQGTLVWRSATVYPAIGPTLKRDYPEVENMCRLYNWSATLTNLQTNVKFFETKGYFADPSALQMLGVQMIEGDPVSAFQESNQIILSESMAHKYFGRTDPVGKALKVPTGNAAGYAMFTVSGVFRDYPSNAHLVLQYLTPYASLESYMRSTGDTTDRVNTSFSWYDYYVYLQLRPGTNAAAFEAKLPSFCDHYINQRPKNLGNLTRDELHLIPLSDIHLHSNENEEAEMNGNGQAVSFLFLIAIFVLGIGWINYINLSTARSVERAREVGVRKVMGAVRSDLVGQFMLEAIWLNLISLVVSITAAYLLAPAFNGLMAKGGTPFFHMTGAYWLLFVSILFGGILLSGLYPALVLSGYKPINVLKGAFKNTSGGLSLRKGLMVFQFAISVILIAGTLIVYQQVTYMRRQQLGADISKTMVLTAPQSLPDSVYADRYPVFKNEILKLPGVMSITSSSSVMGQEITWTRGIAALGGRSEITMYVLNVDYDFVPQYGIRLLAGRNYSRDFEGDAHHRSMLLNETGARALGFTSADDAVGKKILGIGADTITVIGVVADVHHLGLRRPIDPEILPLDMNVREDYSIKLSASKAAPPIAAIKKSWDRFFPEDPFNYFFLDDFYGEQYQADQRFGMTFTLFALMAIFIACLGLTGLSAYNMLQRTKEIGIRKVLGASNRHVVYLLSSDFLRLIVIAFVLAIPIAWWVMHAWLQDFAYRIDIHVWVFVVAGGISIIIALATIGFHAVRAALANPIQCLRTD